ncbi:hypothetical protein OESDEN_20270 [Oesophagostomum dentatum]|uniref:Uncharacterized protein n=1 Tax=Oesophagostomum dentatum TaxID=61180 RepID=A0A0B1S565_OESDE|nr:hypothetical protein OESDEN_20270 [Oesophagostomum dentatum]
MFNWTTFLTLFSLVLFLALCNANPIDVAELERIFRSNPSAMARFQEMFGAEGLSDSVRLSNLQRLG